MRYLREKYLCWRCEIFLLFGNTTFFISCLFPRFLFPRKVFGFLHFFYSILLNPNMKCTKASRNYRLKKEEMRTRNANISNILRERSFKNIYINLCFFWIYRFNTLSITSISFDNLFNGSRKIFPDIFINVIWCDLKWLKLASWKMIN